MFKNASRHLGWLGITKNHIGKNKTIEDDPIARRSAFIAKLRDRARLKAIISSIESDRLLLRFDQVDILGEANIPSNHVSLTPNTPIVVELLEKNCRNGMLFLTTKFIRKIEVVTNYVCKRCEKVFSTFDELNYHLEYLCKFQRCRFCGELYQSKNETAHESGRCKFNIGNTNLSRKQKKRLRALGSS